jgi:L-seryl-tRNA(Ser) seleniumtransferase
MKALRRSTPPVIARTVDDKILFDPRTVLPEQEGALIVTLKNILGSL